jgi:SpoVK/Ycf46/Vps4 family AAA+-type ATPase
MPTNPQRRLIVKYFVDKQLKCYKEQGLSSSSADDNSRSRAELLERLRSIDVNAWADQLVALPVAALCTHVATCLQRYVRRSQGSDNDIPLSAAFEAATSLCYSMCQSPAAANYAGIQVMDTNNRSDGASGAYESNSGVYGHKQQLQALMEAVLWPRTYVHVYQAFHVNPEVGILLFGPPGTGKTMLPGAIATNLKCPMVNIRLCDVVKGTIGTGEQAVREVFAEARRTAPSIVFIDEFQSIFTSRRQGDSDSSSSIGASLASTLSSCFDEVENWNRHSSCESHIVIIAATNEPWAIDRSFLRPGRFGLQLYVGALDLQGRTELLADWYLMQKRRNVDYLKSVSSEYILSPEQLQEHKAVSAQEIDWLADIAVSCEKYSAADMQLLIQRACLQAFNARAALPTKEHFFDVLSTMKPSMTEDEVEEYNNWQSSLKLRA